MNCTDIKTQNKFACLIATVRFTSSHCGNHVGQDSLGLQMTENHLTGLFKRRNLLAHVIKR